MKQWVLWPFFGCFFIFENTWIFIKPEIQVVSLENDMLITTFAIRACFKNAGATVTGSFCVLFLSNYEWRDLRCVWTRALRRPFILSESEYTHTTNSFLSPCALAPTLFPRGIVTKGPQTTYNITTKMIEIKGIKDIPEYTHTTNSFLSPCALAPTLRNTQGGKGN